MKRLIILLIFLILALYFQIYFITNINYISRNESQIQYIGEKELELRDTCKYTEFEHLNVKGKVVEKNEFYDEIELSENSKEFLLTDYIKIKSNDNLLIGDNIFIYFQDIIINDNKLDFSSLKIYKRIDNLNYTNIGKCIFIVENSYGGFMKITGEKIKYKNNIYTISDLKLNNDENIFFEDIENGILLYEEYKDLFIPVIYNMINYQETNFNEMLKLY